MLKKLFKGKNRNLSLVRASKVLFVLSFATVGAVFLFKSWAQTPQVQIMGTVTKVDTNGNRLSYVGGVTIETCLGTTTTGSNGYFAKDIPVGVGFCVRTLNYNPGANYTGPFLRPWSEGYNGCRGYGGPPYTGYCPKPPYAVINGGIQSGYEYQESGRYANNGYDRNQDWGYDIVYVYTPPPPPADTTKPSVPSGLQTTGVTTNSVSIKWNASSDNVGVKGYNVFRSGTKIGTTTSTSYTNTGLTANTTYSYSISAYDAAGNTSSTTASLNAKTSASTTGGSGSVGTAQPPSGGTSSPAPPATNTQASSPKPLQGSNNAPPPPDTTPPSAPANFRAVSEHGKPYVDLVWDGSTDNSGIKAYEIDRSTDQQNWITVQSGSPDTYYQDKDIQFSTQYYYRVRAVDLSNNQSEYSKTEVKTSGFEANVSPDKETSLKNESGTIIVNIPSDSVDKPLQCNVTPDNSTLAPNLNDYIVIEEPHQILCKQEDGGLVTKFNKPLSIEWGVRSEKRASSVHFYGYENEWKPLRTLSGNSKTRTYSFELSNGNVFAAMGKLKRTPVVLKIIVILAGLFGLIAGVMVFGRRRYRQKQQAALEDYWRKMSGG